jgi:hypothetical protein
MSDSKNKLFGQTTMRTVIASSKDIVNSAQRVDTMPDVSSTPVGTIVQLCHPQPGYILGAYYELSEDRKWVDVSTSVPLASQKVVGCYILLDHRLFLVWGDPVGTADVKWLKTSIYMQDNADSSSGGRYNLVEEDIPNNNPDGVMIKLTAEQLLVEDKVFVAEAVFSDGTRTTAQLSKFLAEKQKTAAVIDGTLCKYKDGSVARTVYSVENGKLDTTIKQIDYTAQNDCLLVIDLKKCEIEGWHLTGEDWVDYLDVYVGGNIAGRIVDASDGSKDFSVVSIPVKAGSPITIKGSGKVQMFLSLSDDASLTISELRLSQFGSAEDVFVKSVQSDWSEKDTSSAAYIRNKPCLIRKIYVSKDGDLIVITDEPTGATDFYIDDDGCLIMDIPDDDSDEAFPIGDGSMEGPDGDRYKFTWPAGGGAVSAFPV